MGRAAGLIRSVPAGEGARPRARLLRHASALLLASTCLVATAQAQDATWSATPGSGDFNTAANWTPVGVPTGTASFATSTVTNLSFSTNTTLGGWTFNAGAANFVFTNPVGQDLTFTGAGILINGGTQSITNNANLFFEFRFGRQHQIDNINPAFIAFAGSSTADHARSSIPDAGVR